MKCPLLVIHIIQEPGKVALEAVQCLGDECGRYDKNTELCYRVAQVRILRAIGDVLGRLADDFHFRIVSDARNKKT